MRGAPRRRWRRAWSPLGRCVACDDRRLPPRPARSGLGVDGNVELVRDLPAERHPGSEPEEDGELFVRVVCLDDMLTVSQLFSRIILHILMCFSVTLLLLTLHWSRQVCRRGTALVHPHGDV